MFHMFHIVWVDEVLGFVIVIFLFCGFVVIAT
jgi:hypothetical protein